MDGEKEEGNIKKRTIRRTNRKGSVGRGVLDEVLLGGPPLWDEFVATWKRAWVCLVVVIRC